MLKDRAWTVATRHPINPISTALPRLDPFRVGSWPWPRFPARHHVLSSPFWPSSSLPSFTNALLPSTHAPSLIFSLATLTLDLPASLSCSLADFRSASRLQQVRNKRERERSRRRSIEREGTVRQSLLPSLSHVANQRAKARGLAFLLPSRPWGVCLVEISVEALRLFGDERWSRGEKRTGQPVTITTKVCASVEETDEGEDEMEDRMPRVFPPTCDRGLSLRCLARRKFLF